MTNLPCLPRKTKDLLFELIFFCYKVNQNFKIHILRGKIHILRGKIHILRGKQNPKSLDKQRLDILQKIPIDY